MDFPNNRPEWPERYENPQPVGRYNLVVIGGGPAGLAAATGAAELGAKVALVERNLLGGGLLRGSFPAQTLLRAARAAAELRDAGQLGLIVHGYSVDFGAVMERARAVGARLAPRSSVEYLRGIGVDVYHGLARFLDVRTLEVGDRKLRFARAVIACGTRAAIPPVQGVAEIEPLTSDTLFGLTRQPKRLAVIGAGSVGVELAQAFARLGSLVTVYEVNQRILPRMDAAVAECVRSSLERDGVRFSLDAQNLSFAKESERKRIRARVNGQTTEEDFDEVLLATGRVPDVEALNLSAAGVEYDQEGIKVNELLRTTAHTVFACGDAVGPYKSAHAADAMARIVIGNALFFGSHRIDNMNIPYVINTDPEVAQVGLMAEDTAKGMSTLTLDLKQLDRAVLDGADDGFIKVIHDRNGHIKGATIVSRNAGELIGELVVAMNHRVSLGSLASAIHPYPTQSELIKRCGDLYRRTLLTPHMAKLIRGFLKWRR